MGLSVYRLIVDRQLLGYTPSRCNEGLLEASFSTRSVSYQRNVGDLFFPELPSHFAFIFSFVFKFTYTFPFLLTSIWYLFFVPSSLQLFIYLFHSAVQWGGTGCNTRPADRLCWMRFFVFLFFYFLLTNARIVLKIRPWTHSSNFFLFNFSLTILRLNTVNSELHVFNPTNAWCRKLQPS
jgi:hypothetical protein